MPFFKPRTAFDKAFAVGIVLKGLDGLIEVLGGIILLFLSPDNINHFVKFFTQGQLNTNSHNFLAVHIIHWAGKLTKGALLFGSIYLLVHGIAKLVLVFEILRNHLWAYIGLIILTTLFIIYQSYEIIFSHSISLGLLTIFDVAVVYLTIREYKKQHQTTLEVTKKS